MNRKSLMGMSLLAALGPGGLLAPSPLGYAPAYYYRKGKPTAPQHPTNKRKQVKLRRKQRHRK